MIYLRAKIFCKSRCSLELLLSFPRYCMSLLASAWPFLCLKSFTNSMVLCQTKTFVHGLTSWAFTLTINICRSHPKFQDLRLNPRWVLHVQLRAFMAMSLSPFLEFVQACTNLTKSFWALTMTYSSHRTFHDHTVTFNGFSVSAKCRTYSLEYSFQHQSFSTVLAYKAFTKWYT